MRIGYGRVSTRDQNPDAQHDALTAAGCEASSPEALCHGDHLVCAHQLRQLNTVDCAGIRRGGSLGARPATKTPAKLIEMPHGG